MSLRTVKRSSTTLALLGISALALALRLLGAEQVFQGPDVIFRGYDSYYHVRRALHSLAHFPEVLQRDSLLNYPYGSAVPWPPLYDGLIAAVAKLLGGGEATLERVAAFAPALLGALAVLPAFLLGRRLGGRAAGLLAALLVATFDAHVAFSRIGFADHHAAAALLGLLLLLSTIVAADPGSGRSRAPWVALAALRVALVLSVPGSVLLLVVTETGLLAASVLAADAGRRAFLRRAGAGSALAAALLLMRFALGAATTADYGLNPNYFTTFHPLFFACIAALHAVLGVLERWRGPGTPALRLGRLLGCGAGLALALVASSADLRRGLEYGLRFLSGTHSAGDRVLEERPLLAYWGRLEAGFALSLFGYGVFLLPFALVTLLLTLKDPKRRPALAIFTAWFALFGAASLSAVRFVNEFSGAAAVGLALFCVATARALAPRLSRLPRAARGALGAAALALLLAPTARVHAARAAQSWRSLSGEAPQPTLEAAMFRFARRVRASTPETRGFLDPSQQPEYGIFAWSGLGHHLQYVARRATAADNFGPVTGLDDRNFLLSDQLFRYRLPGRALRALRHLGAPYVITTDFNWPDPYALLNRLHHDDGSAREGRSAIPSFRLLAESLARGRNGSRFKLFEVVKGAVLEFDAPPESPVEVRVALRTNSGRSLTWSNRGVAGRDGRARLRVPYPSRGTSAQTVARGPVEVFAGSRVRRVQVGEADVREGNRIEVADGE